MPYDVPLVPSQTAWKRTKLNDKDINHRNIILNGAWRPSDDPVEINENFAAMENFYYGEKHPVPVPGMTKVTSAVPLITAGTVSAPVIDSGHQYINERFSERAILIQASNSEETVSSILQNTTAIPSTGNFSSTELYTCDSSKGKFANVPGNNVIFCDGTRNLIWGGSERHPVGILNKDASINFDITFLLTNSINDASNRATLQATTNVVTLYVISDRPISGIKPYIQTPNATAGTTLAAHYWGASGWTTVGTITDGTATTTKLVQTGWITFASTVGLAKQTMMHGVQAYHYRFVWTTIADNVTIVYQLTTQCPMQPITDIWDGEGIQVQKVWRYDENVDNYKDYTVNAAVQDYQPMPVVSSGEVVEVAYRVTYVNISSLVKNKDALYIGCQQRLAGFICYMADKVNINSCGPITVAYFNGTDFATVTNMQDGTTRTGTTKPFAQTGYITWDPPAETLEYRWRVKEEPYLYYYKIMVTGGTRTDANTRIDCIMGIPAEKIIRPYKFPVGAGDVAYLCNNYGQRKNAVRPAAINTATVWKEEIEIGNERALTCGICVPNDMVTGATLLFKNTETWALLGRYPKIQTVQLSDSDGCPAPKSLVAATLPVDIANKIGVKPGIAIWQGTNGVYISDGRSPIPISWPIRAYFDEHRIDVVDLCIEPSLIGESVGWMDSRNWRYHLRVAAGWGATNLNTELVLDLRKMEWSQVKRGNDNDLQYALAVEDSYGNPYQYGFKDDGYMERLDYGKSFDGEGIICKLRLGDIALAGDDPWFETNCESIDILMRAEEITTNNLQLVHYLDSGIVGKNLTENEVSCPGRRLILSHRNANRSGTYHGVEISMTTDDESYGLEPLGIIMNYFVNK